MSLFCFKSVFLQWLNDFKIIFPVHFDHLYYLSLIFKILSFLNFFNDLASKSYVTSFHSGIASLFF